MQRVRIVNESGVGYQTKVTDADTGQEIERVMKVALILEPTREVRAEVTMYAPVLDVIAWADMTHICPCCHTLLSEESIDRRKDDAFPSD